MMGLISTPSTRSAPNTSAEARSRPPPGPITRAVNPGAGDWGLGTLDLGTGDSGTGDSGTWGLGDRGPGTWGLGTWELEIGDWGITAIAEKTGGWTVAAGLSFPVPSPESPVRSLCATT